MGDYLPIKRVPGDRPMKHHSQAALGVRSSAVVRRDVGADARGRGQAKEGHTVRLGFGRQPRTNGPADSAGPETEPLGDARRRAAELITGTASYTRLSQIVEMERVILIQHTVAGRTVVTGYAHMYADGIHVRVGQSLAAGQYIADVGTSGYSTGPHLHFEVRPGGAESRPTDPEPWLATQGALDVADGADPSSAG